MIITISLLCRLILELFNGEFARNYNLVKFSDGSYGVRKGYFCLFHYKNLKYNSHTRDGGWWMNNISIFRDCHGTLEEARDVFNYLKSSIEKEEIIE